MFIYAMLLLTQLILGLVGGSVAKLASFYLLVSVAQGMIMGASFILGAWLASSFGISTTVLFSIAVITGSYFFAAALHGRLLEMGSVFVQYLVSQGLFINVFSIFSLANVHDISWGTKEGGSQGMVQRAHETSAAKAQRRADRMKARAEKLELAQRLAEVTGDQALPAAPGAEGATMASRDLSPQALPPDASGGARRPSTATLLSPRCAPQALHETVALKRAMSDIQASLRAKRVEDLRTEARTLAVGKAVGPDAAAAPPSRGSSRRLNVGLTPTGAASRHTGNRALSPGQQNLAADGTSTATASVTVHSHHQHHVSPAPAGASVLLPRSPSGQRATSPTAMPPPVRAAVPQGPVATLKFIATDSGEASYVPLGGEGDRDGASGRMTRDVGLGMDATQYAVAARELCSADPGTIRRERINRARRIQRAQEEAAEREGRLAREMAGDKARMADEFNSFRVRIVLGWVLSNALLVALVLTWDPSLASFAVAVASIVMLQVGVKLCGSVIYQAMALAGWVARTHMRERMYRVETAPGKRQRLVSKWRDPTYYA